MGEGGESGDGRFGQGLASSQAEFSRRPEDYSIQRNRLYDFNDEFSPLGSVELTLPGSCAGWATGILGNSRGHCHIGS
jgi:hypothetical protein